MPFVAIVRDKDKSKRRIDIGDLTDPVSELSECEISCQSCGYGMFLRFSTLNRPHFVHKPGFDHSCIYYRNGGESPQHQAGKDAIVKYLSSQPEYRDCQIIRECIFEKIDRVADIVIVHPEGDDEVHEVQLSGIKPADLMQRTKDYRSIGVCNVVWWLGGDANNEANRNWCASNLGYFADISFSPREYTVTVDLP